MIRAGTRLFTLAAAFAVLAPAAAHAAPSSVLFDVGKLPLPAIEGKEIADSLASFVSAYSPRVTGTPGDEEAAQFLAAEAKSFGYEVEVVRVPLAPNGQGAIGTAVVASKAGRTRPDEHLLFMGHYDTVAGFGGVTLEGAYDNGAGTMMIRALAKAFADVPTNRSLKFIWYNAEEEGLLTSEAHALAEQEKGLKVLSAFGFDMTGIAWPTGNPVAASCLCIWHGDEDEALEKVQRHVNFKTLGFPEGDGLVELRGVNARNSDERSWDVLGYPVMRWAGMQAAADYPAYHMPDDTMATIDEVAGGRQFFEAGLKNTLNSAFYSALTLDNEMPAAQVTATGSGPVTFDASGSTDGNGTPSGVTWDFGDGTTGTGSKVTHAYAKQGTYVATARVADSLWPQVTTAAKVTVTVTETAAAAANPVAKKPAAKKKKAKPCTKGSKRKRAACRRALAKRRAARRRAAAKRRG